jgi:hypothetical protein
MRGAVHGEVLGAGACAPMGPSARTYSYQTADLQPTVQRLPPPRSCGARRPPSRPPWSDARRRPPWSGVSRDGSRAPRGQAGAPRPSLALAATAQAARAAAAAAGSVEPMPGGCGIGAGRARGYGESVTAASRAAERARPRLKSAVGRGVGKAPVGRTPLLYACLLGPL